MNTIDSILACLGLGHHRLSSSSPAPAPWRTTSTSTVEVTKATHWFEIAGYSRHRGMGCGATSFIRSGTFEVGGFSWSMRFYPDGYGHEAVSGGYVTLFLELTTKDATAHASCDLRIVNQQATGNAATATSVHRTGPRLFEHGKVSALAPQSTTVVQRSLAEAYVVGDRLLFECEVAVHKDPKVSETRSVPRVNIPPPELSGCFGKLLESKDELADVTFVVGGKPFPVHRVILAARSPVFKAQLYGPMKEKDMGREAIDDMEPVVFEAMLYFVYTDSLPPGCLDGPGSSELVHHLLVAADRYGVDRLKLICEDVLCDCLDAGTVLTTLALANQCRCDGLRDACVEFVVSSQGVCAPARTC